MSCIWYSCHASSRVPVNLYAEGLNEEIVCSTPIFLYTLVHDSRNTDAQLIYHEFLCSWPIMQPVRLLWTVRALQATIDVHHLYSPHWLLRSGEQIQIEMMLHNQAFCRIFIAPQTAHYLAVLLHISYSNIHVISLKVDTLLFSKWLRGWLVFTSDTTMQFVVNMLGNWHFHGLRLKKSVLKVKVLYWSHVQHTVKYALCIKPIPEEQWAATAQHPGTNFRILASTFVGGTDWK